MQTQIIALAYDGKQKEQEIVSLKERNGVLAYEILSMKSANNLGDKILGNQTRLKFCDNQDVVHLVTSKSHGAGANRQAAIKSPKPNPILSFFVRSESVANAAERPEDVLKPWRRSR